MFYLLCCARRNNHTSKPTVKEDPSSNDDDISIDAAVLMGDDSWLEEDALMNAEIANLHTLGYSSYFRRRRPSIGTFPVLPEKFKVGYKLLRGEPFRERFPIFDIELPPFPV
ncbi:MAG: hypothetical protein Q9219_000713 [cf. Caloplaca sp. 3 TL-2023]